MSTRFWRNGTPHRRGCQESGRFNDGRQHNYAAVEGDALVLKRRPDSVIRLTPVYADAFRGSIGFIRFHRDAAGQVVSLSVTQDRVWEMRFQRVGSR